MGILVYPKRFSEKPPVGTQLNRGHPLTKGLIACWMMNEGGGATLVDVGRHTPGTINGATWTTTPNGSGLSFNGSSGYVSTGLSESITQISINTIILPSNSYDTNSRNVVAKDIVGTRGWVCRYKWNNENGCIQAFEANGATGIQSSRFTPYNVWVNAAWVHDGTNAYAYENGVLNFTDAATLNANLPATTSIGRRDYTSFEEYWLGQIAFVQFWNRPLSVTEIQWLYAQPYDMFIQPRRYWYGKLSTGDIAATFPDKQIIQDIATTQLDKLCVIKGGYAI